MEYAHKTENCIIGREYLVAHALIEFSNGNKCNIPINPLKHMDVSFGVDYDHYHIEGRFDYKEAKEKGFFDISNGLTNNVLIANEVDTLYLSMAYKILEIKYIALKCKRKKTGINPPSKAFSYNLWYDTYLGKSCAGKKCPHFGTQMITVKGKTFCPLHNLHADLIKEIIVPIY